MVGLEQIDAAPDDSHQVIQFPSRFGSEDRAVSAARAQIRQLLEHAIDELPEAFRTVYMMCEVEQCTVEETATLPSIRPETVKTRLHRARRLLRASLHGTLGEAFPFMGQRCARGAEAVMEWLEVERTPPRLQARASCASGEPFCRDAT